MQITKNVHDNILELTISGNLDVVAASKLNEITECNLAGIQELILDFEEVGEISSAGLGAILKAHRKMMTQGALKILNVQGVNRRIIEATGFADILTIA